MQGNAAAHDVARKARVTKGREEDEKEEQSIKKDDHSYLRYFFRQIILLASELIFNFCFISKILTKIFIKDLRFGNLCRT